MARRVTMWVLLGIFALATTGTANAAQWANPELLLSAKQVKAQLDSADWLIVDCRDLDDYAVGHIPGAISFGKRCKKALHTTTDTVRDSAIAFWILEYLGHDKVHVLNGGIDAWKNAAYSLTAKPTIKPEKKFTVKLVPSRYATTEEIVEIATG